MSSLSEKGRSVWAISSSTYVASNLYEYKEYFTPHKKYEEGHYIELWFDSIGYHSQIPALRI